MPLPQHGTAPEGSLEDPGVALEHRHTRKAASVDCGSRRPPHDDLGEPRVGDEARRRQAHEAGVGLRNNAPDSGGRQA
eukprot:8095718-Alexandrium_andersonii.AAC.1